MRFTFICVILSFHFLSSEQNDALKKDEEEKLHAKGHKDVLSDEKALRGSLKEVIKKVDADKDGDISFHELKVWFDAIQKESIHREFNQRWFYLQNALKGLELGQLNWDAFNSIVNPVSETERQRKRWATVDENQDGVLSKEEFFALLYPRFTGKHENLELHETYTLFDKDGDGKINFPEFYRYVIHNRRKELDPFIPSERQGTEQEYKAYFDSVADLNKDGFLDENELKRFVYGDQSGIATHNLFLHHDDDKNGKLSVAEVLKSPQHFTRILPHEFWDALNSRRDEL